jgi:hypothetical protein
VQQARPARKNQQVENVKTLKDPEAPKPVVAIINGNDKALSSGLCFALWVRLSTRLEEGDTVLDL